MLHSYLVRDSIRCRFRFFSRVTFILRMEEGSSFHRRLSLLPKKSWKRMEISRREEASCIRRKLIPLTSHAGVSRDKKARYCHSRQFGWRARSGTYWDEPNVSFGGGIVLSRCILLSEWILPLPTGCGNWCSYFPSCGECHSRCSREEWQHSESHQD